MQQFNHTPVLLNELVKGVQLKPGDIAVDCTTGGGGHSSEILQQLSSKVRLYCIDRDLDAINHLQKLFVSEIESGKVKLYNKKFSSIANVMKDENVLGKISAVIADLGVSSHQIDHGIRGFSFMNNGPLDMRMDQSQDLTAEKIINNYSENELTDIFFKLGEEKKAKAIAKKIVAERNIKPITTTHQLASIACMINHNFHNKKKHPATRIFQALRIEVNSELKELDCLLDISLKMLKPKGHLGIITFHSIEDRTVKNTFKKWSGKTKSDMDLKLPFDPPNQLPSLGKIVKPFPIVPLEQEISNNPRSRSAKLRIFCKN